jgi:hypothetical protein
VSAFEPKQCGHPRWLPGGEATIASSSPPGLKLNWNAIEGLVETLGKNGVTSNYRYDLAPYTWKLVRA